jgi:hypothetical protein
MLNCPMLVLVTGLTVFEDIVELEPYGRTFRSLPLYL